MATAFIDMIGFAMVLPLLPFYAVRLGAEEWMVGPLVAAFAVAQLASAPIWGRVSDRYGRRPVILAGLLGGAVAYAIFGLATSLGLLFLSRLAQGAGGGTTGVIQAYIADSTPPAQRARALGWLTAATSAGVMIGPAIGSLAFSWGVAAPGLLASALCLSNLGFATRWLPEPNVPPRADRKRTRRPIRHAVMEVLQHPTGEVARLIWIYAVGMGAFTAMTTVLPLFLNVRFGITEMTIGYFFLYIGALSVVLRAVIIGWLVDRLGESRVMRLGAAALALGFTLMPLAPSLASFLVAAALLPVGTALLFPATSAQVTRRASAEEMGQTLGVQQAFGGGARVVGPIWGAGAYQILGAAVPFFASAGLVATMLVVAMGERVTPAQDTG
jgi:MFS family permease